MVENGKTMNGGKKAATVTLSIVAVLLVVLGVLFSLLLNDPGRSRKSVAPEAGTILTKLGAAALGGEPAQLSQEELNGLLASKFSGTAPQCQINADDTLDVYFPVNYKGIRIGVTANVSFSFNQSRQQVMMRVHSVHAGRLPLSPKLALKLGQNRLPHGVSAEGDFIYADVSWITGGDLSSVTGIEITDMKIMGQKLLVSVEGNPDKFREFIVQSLPDIFNFFK